LRKLATTEAGGFAAALFADEPFFTSPIWVIGLLLTSVRFSFVQTFLVFLGSAMESGLLAAGVLPVVCGGAGELEAGESCPANAEKQYETETANTKSRARHLNLRPMVLEYQG